MLAYLLIMRGKLLIIGVHTCHPKYLLVEEIILHKATATLCIAQFSGHKLKHRLSFRELFFQRHTTFANLKYRLTLGAGACVVHCHKCRPPPPSPPPHTPADTPVPPTQLLGSLGTTSRRFNLSESGFAALTGEIPISFPEYKEGIRNDATVCTPQVPLQLMRFSSLSIFHPTTLYRLHVSFSFGPAVINDGTTLTRSIFVHEAQAALRP